MNLLADDISKLSFYLTTRREYNKRGNKQDRL